MREFNTKVAEGDYSITFETDDRKAFEQVHRICRILVDGKDVDAIPIEWIKKYYADITMPYTDTRIQFEEMIRKWEKENETN